MVQHVASAVGVLICLPNYPFWCAIKQFWGYNIGHSSYTTSTVSTSEITEDKLYIDWLIVLSV